MQVKETGSPAALAAGKTITYYAVQSATMTSGQLAEFTGKYLSDELPGTTYTLSLRDGKLILEVTNGITVFSDRVLLLAFGQSIGGEPRKDIVLTPAFTDAFLIAFATGELIVVRFLRNQRNEVSGFTLTTQNVRRLRFDKQ
jgi:hypothetical protein